MEKIRLKKFEALAYTFMTTYISEADLKRYLKTLEVENKIRVERYPEKTPTRGKKSSFWDEENGKSLWIIP